MILCPLLPAFFFQVSHNFMKHCSCSVTYLFFSPFLSLFFSFFVGAGALFSWYFFPIRPYLFPPPPGEGGGGIFQYIYPSHSRLSPKHKELVFWLFLLSYMTSGPFSWWYFLLWTQPFFWYYFSRQVMAILCCVAQKAASAARHLTF